MLRFFFGAGLITTGAAFAGLFGLMTTGAETSTGSAVANVADKLSVTPSLLGLRSPATSGMSPRRRWVKFDLGDDLDRLDHGRGIGEDLDGLGGLFRG